jgi:uncharacterized protein (DUF433 family)
VKCSVATETGETLKQHLDDPAFPHITNRRGASGEFIPVIRGRGLGVQTVVVAAQTWRLSPAEIAAEYDLTEAQVHAALTFYHAYRHEIDSAIAAEVNLEPKVYG